MTAATGHGHRDFERTRRWAVESVHDLERGLGSRKRMRYDAYPQVQPSAVSTSSRSPPPPLRLRLPPPPPSPPGSQSRYPSDSPSPVSTPATTPLDHHHHHPHSHRLTGLGDRPPLFPRGYHGPPGPSTGQSPTHLRPSLPPLPAGPTAAPAGPTTSSTSSPSHPILPPISNLDHPHRPSLPPPPPPPGAQQLQHTPSLPPPPPPPAHLTRPPPSYDANPYPRAHSSSPSAHASAHGMASHAPPPPPPHGHHPQGPPPPGPPPGMMPPHHHPQYHYGPPGPPMPGHPPPHGMDPNAYHRMPLPAPMGHMQAHRPPSKKEIKRRTKTGCLTCRRRRIKCDEGHPTCRNCEKSKRQCQGYDPIFKPQSQPSTIQAAPNAPATSRPPATQPGYPPATQPYMAPPPTQPYPPQTTPGAPAQMSPQQYSIDPSLEQSAPTMTAPTTIEHLLDIGDCAPPQLSEPVEPLSSDNFGKAKEIYNVVYGAGLDKFFDTVWFSKQSWQHIAADANLVAKVSLLESRFHVTAERDAEANQANQSLEGHMLWDVMQLCRTVAANINQSQPPEDSTADVQAGVHDVARRIQVFEALITNQHLSPADGIPKPPNTPRVPGNPQLPGQLEDRKLNFWHALSKFTTLRVPDSPSAAENHNDNNAVQTALNDVENCLTDIRQVLDAFENRDILYSVAIVRHYLRPGAGRVPPPSSNDEADRGAKLTIARNFLAHEKHSGTFQVAKVVAGMVVRSWRPQQDGA